MRTDLGTWAGPQADAVVRVLRRAGCDPHTEPAADGVRISVPADQHDRAHAALVEHMDDIARAALRSTSRDEARPTRRQRTRRTPPDQRPLVLERLRNFAPLVVLVAALLAVAFIPSNGLRIAVFVVALVALGVAISDRHDDDEYGPGSR